MEISSPHFSEMLEVVKYIDTQSDVLPEVIADSFLCLARPSPVRWYIRPLEEVYRLIKKFVKDPSEKAFFSDFSHRFKLKPTCPAISNSFQFISLSRQPFQNNGDGSSVETLGSDSC